MGFRVPGDVIDYAARLLPHDRAGLAPPTSVRRSRGDLVVVAAARPSTRSRDAVAPRAAVRADAPDAGSTG